MLKIKLLLYYVVCLFCLLFMILKICLKNEHKKNRISFQDMKMCAFLILFAMLKFFINFNKKD